jgi:hypothetical protein
MWDQNGNCTSTFPVRQLPGVKVRVAALPNIYFIF